MIIKIRKWILSLLAIGFFAYPFNAFACEAALTMSKISNFASRGVLGSESTYIQRVYSGENMSFSTVVLPEGNIFNKASTIKNTAKSMISTVVARTKNFRPEVKLLNDDLLPRVDSRLAFLSYVEYGDVGQINLEASSVIQIGNCWAILRFTALAKASKDEALNQFASLIRATKI